MLCGKIDVYCFCREGDIMQKIGFDNEKYLKLQSKRIKERIEMFGGKLYLEFGGKLFDDFHASRVLPGFAPDNKIKKALDYIHVHFRSEEISISSLAAMCSVSETYFRKQFKNLYSVPPNQYIINLRLENASQLLQSELYTVAEAAEKSGFNDTKYFSRIFKQHFNMSPKEYSKNIPVK